MEAFKYSLFAYEDQGLPEELRIAARVLQRLGGTSHGEATLGQLARSLTEAAQLVDEYRHQSCGSAYNLALINLNHFPSPKELQFLLSEEVLGNPWTIFTVSLRHMNGATYSAARQKVDDEAAAISRNELHGAPSCIHSYTAQDLRASADHLVALFESRLTEEESYARARESGRQLPSMLSPTEGLMRQSKATYYGQGYATRSGALPRVTGLGASSPERANPRRSGLQRTVLLPEGGA